MQLTHYQALLHELAQHGRVTYAELLTRYDESYNYEGFAAAVYKARKCGVVAPCGGSGKGTRPATIVAVGVCPCCGRPL